MGYSYGGGVALRALSPQPADAAPIARAAILVYPDCALADALGPKLVGTEALDDRTEGVPIFKTPTLAKYDRHSSLSALSILPSYSSSPLGGEAR